MDVNVSKKKSLTAVVEKPQPHYSEPHKPTYLKFDLINADLTALRQVVSEHAILISQLQESLARKRRPVASNGKIQIRDKQTGRIYPSENNAYQSLLKAGELKSLVDKGVFGDVLEKDTFGWYAFSREWPDRFEEVAESKNSE